MDSYQGVLRVLPITNGSTTYDYTTTLSEKEVRTIGDNVGCSSPLGLSKTTLEIDGIFIHKNNTFSLGQGTNATLAGNGSSVSISSTSSDQTVTMSISGGKSMKFDNLFEVRKDTRNKMTVDCDDIKLGKLVTVERTGNIASANTGVIQFGTKSTPYTDISAQVYSSIPVRIDADFYAKSSCSFQDTMFLRPNRGTTPSELQVNAVNVKFSDQTFKGLTSELFQVVSENKLVASVNASTITLNNVRNGSSGNIGSMEIVTDNGIIMDEWKLRTHEYPSKNTVLACDDDGYIKPLSIAALNLADIQGAELVPPVETTNNDFVWNSMI